MNENDFKLTEINSELYIDKQNGRFVKYSDVLERKDKREFHQQVVKIYDKDGNQVDTRLYLNLIHLFPFIRDYMKFHSPEYFI